MRYINQNYEKLVGSYLFAEVARRVEEYAATHPEEEIIRLGIGDVTQPLPAVCVQAMQRAAEEMGTAEGFRGYGPYEGYDFLREAIARGDYEERGISMHPEEVFVSDGAKSDMSNLQEMISPGARIGVADPVYPVYVDSNVMAGRTGNYSGGDGGYHGVVYLPATSENHFLPDVPKERVDVVYLCSPNNPTGAAYTTKQLKKWVDWANNEGVLILFDGAYERFVTEPEIARSIYEIEGARYCAIECRSYSKTAGFTGTRCGYTIIPRELTGEGSSGRKHSFHELWMRRQSTKSNGVSYVVQRAAEAVHSEEGQAEVDRAVGVYMHNAQQIRKGFLDTGLKVYGGVNAPYIWLRTPQGMKSWMFFDKLLAEAGVVGTPGSGFGVGGEGYFRLTAFNTKQNTQRAMERICSLKL